MKKKELEYWMNLYHDEWIRAHNKLIDIQHVLDGITKEDFQRMKEEVCENVDNMKEVNEK